MTEPEFTERAGRSLVNTFPFNSADTSLPSRVDRQGGNDVDVDFASVAAAGKRCIDKVEMVEETEYDEEVKLLNLSLHPPSSVLTRCCVTTLTTAGATPHTQRPTRPNRRRSATRTTRRAASSSTPRRLSKSRSRSVSNPSSRTATPLGPRCAGISSTVLGMQMRRRLSWAVNICEQICFRPSSIRRPESLRTFAAKPFMGVRIGGASDV